MQAAQTQRNRASRCFVCIGLAVVVILIYAPVGRFGFVSFDDDLYVFQNPHVQAGLTGNSIRWALTNTDFFYWQPLIWLSHMLDVQLFGPYPGPQHLVNLALHLTNAVLLFLFLEAVTHAFWRSALVAALFAVHPLRVESVAWISERKDVLSGLFWILAYLAYYYYSKRLSTSRYLLLLLIFVLGLMAKPMLITLPVVFLVLDYWPLRRWTGGKAVAWPLIREKLPLLLLSVSVVSITVIGLHRAGVAADLPWANRVSNAFSAYMKYPEMLIWPTNLSVIYPYRFDIPIWRTLLSCAALVGVTVAVVIGRAERPYLLSGWLWYLVVLTPTVGLIQAGPYSYADRFTYLPSIGILIAGVWWIAEETLLRKTWRTAAISAGALATVTLSWMASKQVKVWENGVTLFARAATVAPQSAIVQQNLGYALATEQRYGEAIPHYQAALGLDPALFQAHYNLGRAFYEQGQFPQSVTEFQQTLNAHLSRDYEFDVRTALGIALAREGRMAEAEKEFRLALNIRPQSAEVHANLGSFLAVAGRLEEAIAQYRAAVQLNPAYTEAHLNLGRALMNSGHRDEALKEFQRVLRATPGNAEAQAAVGTLGGSRRF